MQPFKIRHISVVTSKPSAGANYFYLNLVFEVASEATHFQRYLKDTQAEYTEITIFTHEEISREYNSLEDFITDMNTRALECHTGWGLNDKHGWFTHIEKFDVWRFNEYFIDCAVTRSLVDTLKMIDAGMEISERTTNESILMSVFESLKQWWD
jgi:hypothetical protein